MLQERGFRRRTYSDLVLDCFVSKRRWRFSELRERLVYSTKKIPNDVQLVRELKHLCEKGVLNRFAEGRESHYEVNMEYPLDAEIARSTDLLSISSYRNKDIIRFPKSTFYGLKQEVFAPGNLDAEEARGFQLHSLTIEDIFGEEYGLSITDRIAIGLGKLTIEEARKKSGHYWPKSTISFEEALNKIVEKLLELKKAHRLKVLRKNYERRLEEVDFKDARELLARYKEVFLAFLNHWYWIKEDVEKHIFEPALLITGSRVMDYDLDKEDEIRRSPIPEGEKKLRIRAYRDSRRWADYSFGVEIDPNFVVKIKELPEKVKKSIVKFLCSVLGDTKELYPATITVVARSYSGSYIDSLTSKYLEVKEAQRKREELEEAVRRGEVEASILKLPLEEATKNMKNTKASHCAKQLSGDLY